MRGGWITLAALAAGLGIGYLLGAARDDATTRALSPAAPSPVSPEGGAARSMPSSALGEAVAAIPVAPPPRGSGRITGRVVTPDDEPVRGAVVIADRNDGPRWDWPREGDGPPPSRSLEEEVRRYVEIQAWRRGASVRAESGADGTYALEGLADADYRLSAYAVGYQLRTRSNEFRPGVRPGAVVDYVATPLAEVTVDVRGLEPSARGPVMIAFAVAGRGTESRPWTPDAPALRIAPGKYTVSASVDDGAIASEPVALDLDPAGASIALELRKRPGIRGTVLYEPGQEFETAEVRLHRMNAEGTRTRIESWRGPANVWIRGDRRFRFLEVAPGRYELALTTGNVSIASATVDVADRMVDCDLRPGPLDPALYVVVRVEGPGGEPIDDVEIETAVRSKNRSSSGGGAWQRSGRGLFRVFHHAADPEADADAAYSLTVTSRTCGSREVTYRRGEDREVVVRFLQPGQLTVTIAGYAGSGREGTLSLSLGRAPDDSRRGGRSEREAAIDAKGRAVFPALDPGDYEVSLQIGSRWSGRSLSRTRVTVASGENAVEIAIPSVHTLTVRCPEMRQGQRIELRQKRGLSFEAHVGEDGRAVFENVPAGDYLLQEPRGKNMEVSIPAQREVEFRPGEPNALRVSIRDARGLLAKLGLRDGDLVIGLDGKEFTGTANMQLLLMAGAAKESTTLLLIRGGKRVELSADLRPFLEEVEDHGGELDPATR